MVHHDLKDFFISRQIFSIVVSQPITNHRHRGIILFRFIYCGFAALSLLLSVAAILLRLFPAEHAGRWQLTALFYLSPWQLIALGFVPALFLSLHRRWHRVSGCLAGLASLCTALWLVTSFRVSPDPGLPTKPGRVRIVCWNADAYVTVDKREAARAIARLQPDIVIAQEGVVDYGGQQAAFPPAFPEGWKMEYRPFGTMVISEGGLPMKNCKVQHLDGYNGHVMLTQWTIRGAEFSLLIYDQKSDPKTSRGPALRELAGFVAKHEGSPLMVMGEFNTPPDSTHLKPLREQMDNAFEVAGDGFAGTWPLPFAPLAIDQAWVGKGVRPLRCQHHSLSWRGHQLVLLDVEIRKTDG